MYELVCFFISPPLKFSSYYDEHFDDSISPFYLSWSDMIDILEKVKTGKSSSGQIQPEHIIHGSDKLVFHLHLLFNAKIQHGIVVDDFLKGTITPIIKDSEGDVSDCTNYRSTVDSRSNVFQGT